MVATQLAGYLDKKDSNGVKVRDWAEQTLSSIAVCRVCVPNRKISFKRGCSELFKHSESAVHVQSMKKARPERIDVFLRNKSKESITETQVLMCSAWRGGTRASLRWWRSTRTLATWLRSRSWQLTLRFVILNIVRFFLICDWWRCERS